MNDTMLAVILWGLAVLLLGWTWFPALISGLGGTQYASGFSEDSTTLEEATEPDFVSRRLQLLALGYYPLGTAWMRLTFYGGIWRYETRIRAFRAPDRKSFSLVQQQSPPLDVWWLTTFATVWQDGGLLLTSNAVDQPPEAGDYVVQGMESTDLAAIEELHRVQMDRSRSAGRRPDPDGSLETLMRAMARHSSREARHVGVKHGQSYLLSHAGIHAAMSVPAAVTVGLGHWAVPFTNVALWGLLAVSEYAARRRAGRILRSEIAAQTAGTGQP